MPVTSTMRRPDRVRASARSSARSAAQEARSTKTPYGCPAWTGSRSPVGGSREGSVARVRVGQQPAWMTRLSARSRARRFDPPTRGRCAVRGVPSWENTCRRLPRQCSACAWIQARGDVGGWRCDRGETPARSSRISESSSMIRQSPPDRTWVAKRRSHSKASLILGR